MVISVLSYLTPSIVGHNHGCPCFLLFVSKRGCFLDPVDTALLFFESYLGTPASKFGMGSHPQKGLFGGGATKVVAHYLCDVRRQSTLSLLCFLTAN